MFDVGRNPDALSGWARPCARFCLQNGKAGIEAAELGLSVAMCRRSPYLPPRQLPSNDAESLQRSWQFWVDLWHEGTYTDGASFLDYLHDE